MLIQDLSHADADIIVFAGILESVVVSRSANPAIVIGEDHKWQKLVNLLGRQR